MAKKNKRTVNIWRMLIGICALLLSILGFLGTFGLSKPGTALFSLFSRVLGHFAWVGPYIFLALAFYMWVSSQDASRVARGQSAAASELRGRKREYGQIKRSRMPERKNGKASRQGKTAKSARRGNEELQMSGGQHRGGIPLPPGKLVDLKGFSQYFRDEWTEVGPPPHEGIQELGHNFLTYFGEGDAVRKPTVSIESLHGLRTYFREVDEEVGLDQLDTESPFSRTDAGTVFPRDVSSARSHFARPATPLTSVLPSSRNASVHVPWVSSDGLSYGMSPEVSNDVSEEISNGISHEIDHDISHDLSHDLSKDTSYDLSHNISHAIAHDMPDDMSHGIGHNISQAILLDLSPESPDPPAAPRPLEQSAGLGVPGISDNSGLCAHPERISVTSRDVRDSVPLALHGDSAAGVVPHSPPGAGAGRQEQAWLLPELDLLELTPNLVTAQENETPMRLESALQDFGVKAKVIRVARGPVITRYELAPAPGVKISRIVNLADDIALALAARDVRIEAPIPGKAAIGIEIPNKQARTVNFREVVDTGVYRQNTSLLKVAFGKDIANQSVVGDLAKMPHLLVAGATGAGKSVCITAIIQSILFNATPNEVKFLLIDPKMVELNHYNGVPHLLAPVVTDPQKAATALKWIVKEMENRYELFAAAGVRDIARYNQAKMNSDQGKAGVLPWIMVVIDELADLMLVAAGDVEEAIGRLAQMARAAGIHLVIATQRPSVDVITGVIKANIPSRISFAVSSQIDSRTILDAAGAEKLIGKGDMLYSPLGLGKPIRVQGCLVTDDEVERVITHWKTQGKPEYLDPERLFSEGPSKSEDVGGPDDELFMDAGRLMLKSGMASVTFLQRRLKLGYARAARLMDMLEEQGVVGPYEGSKPRQLLVSLEEFEERYGSTDIK